MPRNEKLPYVYVEYPKWVKRYDGVDVIVNNENEELEALEKPKAPQAAAKTT